ncbi:MAG: DUF3048 domain-containing protein [Oscillospiraceae bacterium]|nr:DUF3048 domain-containing protein [Oscillospiraceae bacterium]
MKKRLFTLLLAAGMLLTLLSACGGDTAETPTPTPTDTADLPYDGTENPLTGLPMDEKWLDARPVAIMLNNLKGALPQQGNSDADIIYEVPAEGGITRMLAVYQSVEGLGIIGSIRSSRPYYLELALGHDALYIHAGGSEDAYAKIKSWGVDAFDCVRGGYESRTPGGNMMWRDPERKANMAYEHTVVTTGEAILQYLPEKVEKTHASGYQYGQTFVDDGTPAGGGSAVTLTVPFSNYKTGVFNYDEESGTYLVQEYGQDYIDGNTGEQVAVTNVLVLKTACNLTGDSLGHITVELDGGEGYFACGGKIVPICWSKADRNSPIVYTNEDGTPLALGRGKSYVNIVPLNSNITFE